MTIQKQSDNVKNVNTEIAFEQNNSYANTKINKINMQNVIYKDLLMKLGCIDMKSNIVTSVCNNPNFETVVYEAKTDNLYYSSIIQSEKKVALIEYIKTLGVSFSSDAIMMIFNSFNIETRRQYHTCYNKITKVTTVLTSKDVIFIRVRYENVLQKIDIKQIHVFNDDPINNLIMMVCFSIPMDTDIEIFKKLPKIHLHRKIIQDYYKKYYVYILSSVSLKFSLYLDSDE